MVDGEWQEYKHLVLAKIEELGIQQKEIRTLIESIDRRCTDNALKTKIMWVAFTATATAAGGLGSLLQTALTGG